MRRINKIEGYEFYLDVAAQKAKKKANETKQGYSGKLNLFHYKQIEMARVSELSHSLQENFRSILTSFPSLDSLTPFYTKLIKVTVDYVELKKSLGALNFAINKIKEFELKYIRNIKMSREVPTTGIHRRAAYGRIMSVPKQIRKALLYLEEVRVVFTEYPSVKDMYTVCIGGFPNVGKSTLLSKVTPANPEIANYSFTTKKLNLGYTTIAHHKIQIMDTPGTLNRMEKMNVVETQAHLALQHVANIIIYVFDLSPGATAPLADQKKLLSNIEDFEKPIVIYLAKSDITDKKIVDEFVKENNAFTTPEQIEKEIARQHKLTYVSEFK